MHRESSAVQHQSLQSHVERCAEKVGLKADKLSKLLTDTLKTHDDSAALRSDDLLCRMVDQQNVITTFHALHQETLVRGNASQTVLRSALESHHQQSLKSHNKQHHKLDSLVLRQGRMDMHQRKLARTSVRTHEQTSRVLSTVQSGFAASHQHYHDLAETLATGLNQLTASTSQQVMPKTPSRRQIQFLGERPDQIMMHLLNVMEHLKPAISKIISQKDHEVSIRQACWLESEFQHLIGSAAQEAAAQYSGSTAQSFDEWKFPRSRTKSSRYTPTSTVTEHGYDPSIRLANQKHTGHKQRRPKRRRRPRRTLKFSTGDEMLYINFPNDASSVRELEYDDEISISFANGRNLSSYIIEAHFLYAGQRPGICTQLDVFTFAPPGQSGLYRALFRSGTVSDIDTALRNGTISPYSINHTGENLWLYVSILLSVSCLGINIVIKLMQSLLVYFQIRPSRLARICRERRARCIKYSVRAYSISSVSRY